MELTKYLVIGHLIAVLIFATAKANAIGEVPFKSREEIRFIAKTEKKFLDFGKTDSFWGILERPWAKEGSLRIADIYRFDAGQGTQAPMDKKFCDQMLGKIFGTISPLKYERVEIFKTERGPVCEAQVIDEKDPKSKHFERRVIVGYLNMKPFALVFHFSKNSTASEQEDIRRFWQGLR